MNNAPRSQLHGFFTRGITARRLNFGSAPASPRGSDSEGSLQSLESVTDDMPSLVDPDSPRYQASTYPAYSSSSSSSDEFKTPTKPNRGPEALTGGLEEKTPKTPTQMSRAASEHWRAISRAEFRTPKKIQTFVELMGSPEYATLSKDARAQIVTNHYNKLALRDKKQLGLVEQDTTCRIGIVSLDIIDHMLGFLDLFSAVLFTRTSNSVQKLRIRPQKESLERFFNPRQMLVAFHHNGEAYKGTCAWIFEADRKHYKNGVDCLVINLDIPNRPLNECYSAIPFPEIGFRVTFSRERVAKAFFPRKDITKRDKLCYAPDSTLPQLLTDGKYNGTGSNDTPVFTIPSYALNIKERGNLDKYLVGEYIPMEFSYVHVPLALELEATRPNGLAYAVGKEDEEIRQSIRQSISHQHTMEMLMVQRLINLLRGHRRHGPGCTCP